MLNQPTMDKLQALRLAVMAQAWQEQNKNPKLVTLCFDERFAMLVDAEHMARRTAVSDGCSRTLSYGLTTPASKTSTPVPSADWTRPSSANSLPAPGFTTTSISP